MPAPGHARSPAACLRRGSRLSCYDASFGWATGGVAREQQSGVAAVAAVVRAKKDCRFGLSCLSLGVCACVYLCVSCSVSWHVAWHVSFSTHVTVSWQRAVAAAAAVRALPPSLALSLLPFLQHSFLI